MGVVGSLQILILLTMSSTNLRLYNIFRKKFNLSEDDALEAALEMQRAIQELTALTTFSLHHSRDIGDVETRSFRDFMSNTFATKVESNRLERQLELKLEQMKNELTNTIYFVSYIQVVGIINVLIWIAGIMLHK